MPVDIVSTDSSPYTVMKEAVEMSSHSTPHVALENAVNLSESCKCVITVNRNLEWRVTYEPLPVSPQPPNSDGTVDLRSVKISWAPPQFRENGEALAEDEIASYDIKVRSSNGEQIIDAGNVLYFIIDSLSVGDYFFSVRTIDTNSIASEWSEEFFLSVE